VLCSILVAAQCSLWRQRQDIYSQEVTSWALGNLQQQITRNLTSELRGALIRAPVDVRLYVVFQLSISLWIMGSRDTHMLLSRLGAQLVQELQSHHVYSVFSFNAFQLIMLSALSVV
jgi:hypothetical protein